MHNFSETHQNVSNCVCVCDTTHDIRGHTGVEGLWPIRDVFGLNGSTGEEQGDGDAMPEERRPRQIAVMN